MKHHFFYRKILLYYLFFYNHCNRFYIPQGDNATSSKYETSIDWLNAAFMTKPCILVKRLEYPLKAFAEASSFRLYMTDIGLYLSTFDFVIKKALIQESSLEERSANVILGMAKGGLFEALAADMLYKRDYPELYYYKNEKNTSEVEFIITNDNGILPIEIKAGKKKANSLNGILRSEAITEGFKLSAQNIGSEGKRVTMPIYMLMFV